jgi:general secretion pathway protein M
MMKLATREKHLIWAGAVCVAIFILVQFLVFPFFESKRRMARGLKAKEKGLAEIARLSAEYQTYQTASQVIREALSKRKGGFTLFSFLDDAAGKAQVKVHIKYMKPSTSVSTGPFKESTVEMKLEALTLEQLVGYLYLIESPSDLVSIKRLSIADNKKQQGYLDAIVQVLTFQ